MSKNHYTKLKPMFEEFQFVYRCGHQEKLVPNLQEREFSKFLFQICLGLS